MRNNTSFYINGEWITPADVPTQAVINPANDQVAGVISMGSEVHVVQAVQAARSAFDSYSQFSREQRIELMQNLAAVYERRVNDMAEAITEEMGSPLESFSKTLQAPAGLWHIQTAIEILKEYSFETMQGSTCIAREPIGVCGLITPWNYPINQIACKVAPALATGCTIVLKPSVEAPFSGHLLAEFIDEAGFPAGVFNLVHGAGSKVGATLSAHPDVDMISLTGSTGAGKQISVAAAETIKRVSLELGGKSANIILDDADLEKAVTHGVQQMMANCGQTCTAPSRMIVPASRLEEVEAIAKAAVDEITVGDPMDSTTMVGPMASRGQFDTVQRYITIGIEEGAHLLAGGPGHPQGLEHGRYVKPTIFSRVSNDMTIAREEIFGPVLCIIPAESEAHAIDIANDSIFGLSGFVSSGDLKRARRVASQIRTGMVHINGAPVDITAPFGGYKQSGIGREWGAAGFDEFLEIKSIMGFEHPESA